MDRPLIRPARAADFPRLQQIETLAGAAFADHGMPAIAADAPPSTEDLAGYTSAGRAWVCTVDTTVAAYLLARPLPDTAHIDQVSTDPTHRGHGLGRLLIDHLETWARNHHLTALTLTTFRDIPWNAPYYRRLGFTEVPATGPLATIVTEEATHGLDPALRLCMRREISRNGSGPATIISG